MGTVVGERGLLSIGYEGRSSDELIHELLARGVSALADVRLNPISRKSGLSKRALTEALDQAQIEYLHLPELGNPKSNRDGFQDALSQEPRDHYRRLLVSREALAALDVLGQRRPTTPIQRV